MKPAYKNNIAKYQTLVIKSRSIDCDLKKEKLHNWNNGDRFSSQWFNALSTLLPVGEHIFMSAVLRYRSKVKNPLLLRQIKGFIQQESFHSKMHDQYNDLIKEAGYNLAPSERRQKKQFRFIRKNLSPIQLLALSVGLEQLTAVLAEVLLENDFFKDMDSEFREVWLVHACEELEHKAVVFDIYSEVGGTYLRRILTFMYAYVALSLRVSVRHARFLKQDGFLFNIDMWRRGLGAIWGRNGIMLLVLKKSMKFFNPSFHPWDCENYDLVKRCDVDRKVVNCSL